MSQVALWHPGPTWPPWWRDTSTMPKGCPGRTGKHSQCASHVPQVNDQFPLKVAQLRARRSSIRFCDTTSPLGTGTARTGGPGGCSGTARTGGGGAAGGCCGCWSPGKLSSLGLMLRLHAPSPPPLLELASDSSHCRGRRYRSRIDSSLMLYSASMRLPSKMLPNQVSRCSPRGMPSVAGIFALTSSIV